MTNHADISTIELFIRQLPLVEKQFDCILVECVPNHLGNQPLLNYLSDNMLGHELDLRTVQQTLGLSNADCLALRNVYQNPMSDEEKMQLKYEIIKKIRGEGDIHFSSNMGSINMLFFQFYYYHFLSQALKRGIQLVGIEKPGYAPGRGRFDECRNDSIVFNARRLVEENKNCLLVIGANHGIDLIKALRKSNTIKNVFTHLYCDLSVVDSQSESNLFRAQIEKGAFKLSDQQSYLYLDLSQKSKLEQDVIFCERVLTVESAKSIYHQYGRFLVEGGTVFSNRLSNLSHLTFFTTIDQVDFVADAMVAITSEDEKTAAEVLKEKTNLGDFFNNEQGQEVFVIKDTNATERLDLLKCSLDRIG